MSEAPTTQSVNVHIKECKECSHRIKRPKYNDPNQRNSGIYVRCVECDTINRCPIR